MIRNGHPTTSRKYALIYGMNFDYCLQTKEKKKNKNKKIFSCDIFYFLVLDFLES